MQRHTTCAMALALPFLIFACPRLTAATTCENLSAVKLPDTTILLAQRVAAGALTLPTPLPSPGPHGGLTYVSAKDLPEFCRVAGVTKPSKGSEIKFEGGV